MDISIVIMLVMGSGLFSGLTIGLLGLSKSDVLMAADLGNIDAKKVLEVIKDINLLLVTLLLGNTAINATLSIFMGQVVGEGLIAGLTATGVILIFGEILPASFLSKHALYVGAKTAWLVKLLMVIFYPITKPIALALDKFVGVEGMSFFSKKELIYIINSHEKSNDSDIDDLDNKTIKGALLLDSKTAGDHMSRTIYSLDSKEDISSKLIEGIKKRGFTRIPVMKGQKVLGILNAKSLLGVSDGKVLDFISSNFLTVKAENKLDDILSNMMEKNIHIAMVESYGTVVGIISMEDIIEEIFQREIIDETDV